jgi:hypothetical protein
MWQSATASAVDLLHQQRLLFGGLGGIIAVIVGGVVSVGAIRNSRRRVAQPAPSAQPAPASRRPAARPTYGEPAPPTSPARRLHPGPVSLSAPVTPRHDGDEEAGAEVGASLFNPDVFASKRDEPEDSLAELATLAAVPLLRPTSSIAAEWRAQATPLPASSLTHAPIWNRAPFARPDTPTAAPIAFEMSATIAPPVWPLSLASAPTVAPAQPGAESFTSLTSHVPVWDHWLRASSAPTSASVADEARLPEALGGEADAEPEPPIWPSFLRPD